MTNEIDFFPYSEEYGKNDCVCSVLGNESCDRVQECNSNPASQPAYINFENRAGSDAVEAIAQAGFFSNGCEWALQNEKIRGERSCFPYCSWHEMATSVANERGNPITTEELEKAADHFFAKILLENARRALKGDPAISRVDFYHGGSHLSETTIPWDLMQKIYRKFSQLESVKKILMEARCEHITEEKLDDIESLGKSTGVKPIIALGVETLNKKILKRTKKGLTPEIAKSTLFRLLGRDTIIPQIFLMVKPDVMSEKNAIKQSYNDLETIYKWLEDHDVDKKITINLAPLQPFEGSGADLNTAYKPSSLWSLVAILEEIKIKIPKFFERISLYISVDSETGSSEKTVTSCDQCQPDFMAAIDEFNKTQDVNTLGRLECDCKQRWKESLITDKIPIGNAEIAGDPISLARKTLREQILDDIMRVEEEAWPEDLRANRQEMRRRIKEWGGNLQIVAYDPKGEEGAIAYVMSKLADQTEIEDIPEEVRGWDRLSQLKNNPDGTIINGVSLAKRPKYCRHPAAQAVMNGLMDEVTKSPKLDELRGTTRIPSLKKIVNEISKTLGVELSEADAKIIAELYLDAHKKDMILGAKLTSDHLWIDYRGEKWQVPVDTNLRYYLSVGFTTVGPVVKSMKDDNDSMGLGVTVRYKNDKETISKEA